MSGGREKKWAKKADRLIQHEIISEAPIRAGEKFVEMRVDTTADDVATILGVPPGKLYITIKRPEKYPVGPIALGPAETVINVEKFAEITIKDVIQGIYAINRGHLLHWAVSLIDEKIEKLRLCGVEVEIRSSVEP